MISRIDPTLVTIEQAMSLRLQRQALLAGNLANIDTPNFVPRDLSRSGCVGPTDSPDLALETGGQRHIAGESDDPARDDPVLSPDRQPGLDGNAVDLDHQMVFMAQNSGAYSTLARVAQKKLALLKYAVAAGGV